MKKALTLAAAARLAVAAFSQPQSDLRPDKTVLLYAESADSLIDPVVGRSVEYAGYTIEEDNGLRGPETVKDNGGIGNIKNWLNDKNYSNDGKTLKNYPSNFSETKNYVRLVDKAINTYIRLYYD